MRLRFDLADDGKILRRFARSEYRVERVVIGGRDVIILMVVAAGAGDSKSHKAAGDDIDLVVDLVVWIAELATDRKEAEGR
ncbi:MAG TPA: hypothetical protein PJ982_11695 [Lacipirellulaceae bacterium]|nr:hypothetical protein [Lacipirellulaceae bacterium]